jgi:hypothetical protein
LYIADAMPINGVADACVLLQDPAIKEMAEKIANDPSFQGLTSQLQESMSSMVPPSGGPAPAAPPDLAGFDPSKYMQAMSGMFQNQQFMQMAEKLGQAIIQVRHPMPCPIGMLACRGGC